MWKFSKSFIPDYKQIYFGLLVALVVSLPLSKALMSIFTGILMLNWLIEGSFGLKLRRLKDRKSLQLILSVFIVFILGLIYTNSFKWGIHDIKIQLPLLILPLVIGTSEPIEFKKIKFIIYSFSAAVIVASLCSVWVLLGFSGKTISDIRDISLFISHIRFSLLINTAIFSLLWFVMKANSSLSEKFILCISILWLSIFLIILKSVTGWVIFVVLILAIVSVLIFRSRNTIWRVFYFTILLLVIVLPLIYTGNIVREFYNTSEIDKNTIPEKTQSGNPYSHDFSNRQMENGNYIFLFLNNNEMREEWNKRSKIDFDSNSESTFNQFVLIRYLSSKGLRKDAEGIKQLSVSDIRNIENGMTNFLFAERNSFFKRIYQIIWEIDVYNKGGNPSGHSVTQRIEYYKMAFRIIEKSLWFGHGTGGYFSAYQDEYNNSPFFQEQEYRQRSHNMFLSYLVDFGLFGLLFICFALFYPVIIEQKTRDYLMLIFLLIIVLSFLNEDTLNNHDGVTFFAFFYPLYLFNSLKNPTSENAGE